MVLTSNSIKNAGTLAANVLDLNIEINPNENTAKTSLFDKRRAFDFEVCNYPDVTGNISSAMAYGVITSQLTRFYEASSTFDNFCYNVNILSTKLLQQSYDLKKLESVVKQFVHNHKLVKYHLEKRKMITTILEHIPSNIEVTGRP